MAYATATIYIQNKSGATADITLSHQFSLVLNPAEVFPTQYNVPDGAKAGPFVVNFQTGTPDPDYWWVSMLIPSGTNSGLYMSPGSAIDPGKECALQAADAGQTLTFGLTTSHFNIKMASGSCQADLEQHRTPPKTQIEHVFLLMLENRSFDHMLGFSNLSGLDIDTGKKVSIDGVAGMQNSYNGTAYPATQDAADSMQYDPGHEFPDVLEQLCGAGAKLDKGVYPAINNSGFVSNYATTKSDQEGGATSNFGEIMRCYLSSQLPILNSLAANFVICPKWYSSMPGPTWPNRFFSLAASSGHMDTSPSTTQMGTWDSVDGYEFENGTVFDTLRKARGPDAWRIYSDDSLPPIAFALNNVKTYYDYSQFSADINQPYYQPAFTLIEPNYGASSSGTYYGGNSQHPMDRVSSGEALIKSVYEAIRNSPLWSKSVLIVTYDEHGGFPDHEPPPAATPPGDKAKNSDVNTYGFKFDRYGVRVPAVIVSPFVPKGNVDNKVFDHSSISALLHSLFATRLLTERDKAANIPTLKLESAPRSDCPTTLPDVYTFPSDVSRRAEPVEPSAEMLAEPMIETGLAAGFLYILRKAELELSPPEQHPAIMQAFAQLKTKGDVLNYQKKVRALIEGARAAKRSRR
ncbi:MAG TPA: alkaline phosphatase family protein [Blastocatellia bacterium]|nr:alkaline phosphatase family protein [Blastocatellia bacterium]